MLVSLGLFFSPEEGGDMIVRDISVDFQRNTHSVMSQKIEELFLVLSSFHKVRDFFSHPYTIG
jgi:hypothetical protein